MTEIQIAEKCIQLLSNQSWVRSEKGFTICGCLMYFLDPARKDDGDGIYPISYLQDYLPKFYEMFVDEVVLDWFCLNRDLCEWGFKKCRRGSRRIWWGYIETKERITALKKCYS